RQRDVGLDRVGRGRDAPHTYLFLHGADGVDVDRWVLDALEGFDQCEDTDAIVEVAAYDHVVVEHVELCREGDDVADVHLSAHVRGAAAEIDVQLFDGEDTLPVLLGAEPTGLRGDDALERGRRGGTVRAVGACPVHHDALNGQGARVEAADGAEAHE